MAFLAQFACQPGRLEIAGAICLQLYQGEPENEPCPVVVTVPMGAPENTDKRGVVSPRTPQLDIQWDEMEDPDEPEDLQTELAHSKIGGTCYFWDLIQNGESLILQLRQQPGGFNFGGFTAVIVQTTTGTLETRLG